MSDNRYRWAWNLEIPSKHKFILLALLDCANSQIDTCFPSYSTLAKKTGYSRSTVIRTIAELEAMGHIETIEKSGLKSNHYRVNIGSVTETLVSEVHQCQSDTSVSLTPGGCQADTGGVSHRHPINNINNNITNKLSLLDDDGKLRPDWKPDTERINQRLRMAGREPYAEDRLHEFIAHYRSRPPPQPANFEELFIKWCIREKVFNQRQWNGQNQRQVKFDPGEYILDGIENDLRQNQSSASVRQNEGDIWGEVDSSISDGKTD